MFLTLLCEYILRHDHPALSLFSQKYDFQLAWLTAHIHDFTFTYSNCHWGQSPWTSGPISTLTNSMTHWLETLFCPLWSVDHFNVRQPHSWEPSIPAHCSWSTTRRNHSLETCPECWSCAQCQEWRYMAMSDRYLQVSPVWFHCYDGSLWESKLVYCSRDQWDIYKLDPAYTCYINLEPALTTVRWIPLPESMVSFSMGSPNHSSLT